jgi:ATP-dependent DNA helicase RecG
LTPVPGADDREEKSLNRLGYKSAEDLAFNLPRWIVNRNMLSSFAEAKEGVRKFYLARVSRRDIFKRGRLHIIKIVLDDGSGHAMLYFFNRPYLASNYKPGTSVLIHDNAERAKSGVRFSGKPGTVEELTAGDLERLERGDTVVFYRVTTVIDQERMRKLAYASLEAVKASIPDPVPPSMQERLSLPALAESLGQAHRPAGWTEWERARRRLIFDQLFLLQVALGLGKIAHGKINKNRKYRTSGEKYAKLFASLPFKFTGAQEKVTREIAEDLAKDSPMNRLLQGDVGSGKTVVAAAAIAMAADSGFQSVVMAPTEILAEQHFHTFRRLLLPAGINVGILVSGHTKKQKKQVQDGLDGGYFDLLVGTHAVLEPGVNIPRLGVAVIDERHKFGVNQRSELEGKGKHPDMLMMTATPLPRALVLTQYGDTSLSLLDEMPPGRGGIITKWLHGAMGRDEAFARVAERIKAGERAFVVFPLVEESENLALKDATREYERLKKVFPGVPSGLIHGRLSTEDKEAVMQAFAKGDIKMLISTSVIEVGIDVPEATVMVIENANRFGLAQLHQLRGRVGRSHRPSWCHLVTSGNLTWEAKERLNSLVKTLNGFDLAEMDLKLRGPGELFGTRQHGETEMEHLDLERDVALLESAKEEAEAVLAGDPSLRKAQGKIISQALKARLSDSWDMARVS